MFNIPVKNKILTLLLLRLIMLLLLMLLISSSSDVSSRDEHYFNDHMEIGNIEIVSYLSDRVFYDNYDVPTIIEESVSRSNTIKENKKFKRQKNNHNNNVNRNNNQNHKNNAQQNRHQLNA